METYNKPPLAVKDQIKLLSRRGLLIKDELVAEHALLNYSYYRLSGYWFVLLQDKEAHIFKPNTSLEQALAIYHFDAELRALVAKAIEPIEVALRTKLSYHFSLETGDPLWYEKTEVYSQTNDLTNFLSMMDTEVNRSKEEFIKHHKQKYGYDQYNRMPCWKAMEVISFGNLSKIFQRVDQKNPATVRIAKDFGHIKPKTIKSWIYALVDLRNMCAHHSRIWNKRFMIKPIMLDTKNKNWLKSLPITNDLDKLYPLLCCIAHIHKHILPQSTFVSQLKSLISKSPNIDVAAMGFQAGWENEPLWI